MALVAAPERRIEWGRVLAMPVFTILLVAGLIRLVASTPLLPHGGVGAWLSAIGVLLTAGFNALIVHSYLTRHRARATSPSLPARVAAVIATWLPQVLIVTVGQSTHAGLALASDTLLFTGVGWSIWSLRTLGRSFSIVAQARAVVSSGPYRWVRHPLYVGEVLATLGLALRRPSVVSLSLWAVLVALQAYRAVREEEVLVAALDSYAEYRRRTARLLPGVF